MLEFLVIATVAVGVIYASMISAQNDGRTSDTKMGNLSKKKKSMISTATYLKWYNRFSTWVVFRKDFKRVERSLSDLSIYTSQEVKIKSTRTYGIAMSLSAVALLIGAIVFRDIMATLVVMVYSQIIKNTLIFSQIDKVQFQTLLDFKISLSSVREKFQIKETVIDSLQEAEVTKSLRKSFDEIHSILTGNKAERRLEELYASNPFIFLQTFAGICYQVQESGDERTANNGSNFLDALFKLNEELNLEILRVNNIRLTFKGLTILPILPIFAMSLLQWGITANVPGIAYIYQGSIGYISRVIILVSSIVGYQVISRMNSSSPVAKDDRWHICTELLKRDWFLYLVNQIKPISGVRRRAKRVLLRKSISQKTIEHLYAEKILCSTVLFVFTLSVTVFAVIVGRNYIYNTYTYKSFTADEHINPKEQAKRKALDDSILKAKTIPPDDVLRETLKEMYPKMSEYDKSDQLTRIKDKYELYHNTVFYWWILMLVFLLGLVGWHAPDYILKQRAKMVKEESEEDVLQLQTMISILMNTTADTLDVLYWLARQSRLHKHALWVCCQNYAENPLKAIEQLKLSDPDSPAFVKLCNKLAVTIYSVSMKEAFYDIEADRGYQLEMRKMSQDDVIKGRAVKAFYFALAPLVLTSILYLMVPMGILGMTQYTQAMQTEDQMRDQK